MPEAGGYRNHMAELSIAVLEGDEQRVASLLDRSHPPPPDVNARGRDWWTALHESAYHGHASITQLLIDAQADICAQTTFCRTPLLLAAHGGHEMVVKILLDANSDPAAADCLGSTPIKVMTSPQSAVRRGQVSLRSIWISRTRDECGPGYSPPRRSWGQHEAYTHDSELLQAVMKSDTASARQLCTSDSTVVDETYASGWTPLMLAAMQGDQEMVALLLEAKADGECRAKNGKDAYLMALEQGHEKVALRIRNAVRQQRARRRQAEAASAKARLEGLARLHMNESAKKIGKLILPRLPLPQEGTKPTPAAPTAVQWPALASPARARTAHSPEPDCAEAGISQTSVHSRDELASGSPSDDPVEHLRVQISERGQQVLYFAAREGSADLVAMCVANGARIELPDEHGATALALACINGHQAVVEALVRPIAVAARRAADRVTEAEAILNATFRWHAGAAGRVGMDLSRSKQAGDASGGGKREEDVTRAEVLAAAAQSKEDHARVELSAHVAAAVLAILEDRTREPTRSDSLRLPPEQWTSSSHPSKHKLFGACCHPTGSRSQASLTQTLTQTLAVPRHLPSHLLCPHRKQVAATNACHQLLEAKTSDGRTCLAWAASYGYVTAECAWEWHSSTRRK